MCGIDSSTTFAKKGKERYHKNSVDLRVLNSCFVAICKNTVKAYPCDALKHIERPRK